MYPWPCCTIQGTGNNYNISTALSLVKTGPISPGSVLPAGVLGYWQWLGGTFGPNLQVEAFTLTNPITLVYPPCTVSNTPIVVNLPTVSTSSLRTNGSTSGTTPFTIALTCPSASSGLTMSIELDAAGAASNITGVLLPTSGTSAGVGVQLLNQSFNPVTLGTPTVVGSTSAVPYNLRYYAAYYRTGTLTVGTLTAGATITLSYK